MFKYSFMTFACPEYTLAEVLEVALSCGYDGVELRVASGHGHGAELQRRAREREVIRKQFEEAGVAVACIATSIRFNQPDEAGRQVVVNEACDYCELAAELGSARVRVFGGASPEPADRETEIARVRDGLAACVSTAEACGVRLCLETHDAFCEGAVVARICREVDSPWVRATWDVQHPVTAGESVAFTAGELMPYTDHVHFHDTDRCGERNECVPIGRGQAPIRELLRALHDGGYDGYLSGEWFYNNGPEEDLNHYISSLRAIAAEL